MSTPYRGSSSNEPNQPNQPAQPAQPNSYPAEAPYRPEETLLSGQYGAPA